MDTAVRCRSRYCSAAVEPSLASFTNTSAMLASAWAREDSDSTSRAAIRASAIDCAAPRVSPALACASAMLLNAQARLDSDSSPRAARTASARMAPASSSRRAEADDSPRAASSSRNFAVR